MIDGQAQAALAAADGVLVASGTATLETLLSKRPMVVAYRLGAMTAFLLRRLGLVKVPYFSQPNLLLGRRGVPEFFQEAVTGEALGAALLRELEDPAHASPSCSGNSCACTSRCGAAAPSAPPPPCSNAQAWSIVTLGCASRRCAAHARWLGSMRRDAGHWRVRWWPQRSSWIRGEGFAGWRTPKQLHARGARAPRADHPRPRGGVGRGLGRPRRDRLPQHPAAPRFWRCDVRCCDCRCARPTSRWTATSCRASMTCASGARSSRSSAVMRRAPAISAASILAKTFRDGLMQRLDAHYPGFDLAIHKGYSTPAHLAALERRAPSPLHRRSFSPVRLALRGLTGHGDRFRPSAIAHRVLIGGQRRAGAGIDRRGRASAACRLWRSPIRTISSALVKFYREALKQGVQPIVGVDLLVREAGERVKPTRLALLCQSDEGYRNLTRLVSRAYLEGQRRGEPMIERSWITAECRHGPHCAVLRRRRGSRPRARQRS